MFKVLVISILFSASSLFAENLIPDPQASEEVAGKTTITSITYNTAKAKPVAEQLAKDLAKIYGVTLNINKSSKPRAGSIFIAIPKKNDNSEKYSLLINKGVLLKATSVNGLLAGTASILQLAKNKKSSFVFNNIKVKDYPDRDFRAMMLDVKNQWHTPEDIKKFIDLAYFYKLNRLSLHTGEGQWIGALLNQTAEMTKKEREHHHFYTKAEMDDMIEYGRSRGVLLFPHNECTPNFGHMVNAMKKDYCSSDNLDGFADELDGKGSYSDFTGGAEERWYTIMKIAIDKAIDQFAVAYPNNILPYYHIGPVQGEGGMSPAIAKRIIEYIIAKSPQTKVMFWNGISAKDGTLSPLKDNIIIAYYDDEFGASDIVSYLDQGWEVVNAAWSPLYLAGGTARPVKKVYNDWHILRQGSDGIPGGYKAIEWTVIPATTPTNKLIGGMLCTWEMPQKCHLGRLQTRVPAFAEHAWKQGVWPYDTADYGGFEKRLNKNNATFAKFVGQYDTKPETPFYFRASDGTAKAKVILFWRCGNGYITKYEVLRSDSSNINNAEVIATLPLFAQGYVDTKVVIDQKYYYWLKAVNTVDKSTTTKMVTGSAGTGVSNILSYEPFDYSASASVNGASGGKGWLGNWQLGPKKPGNAQFIAEGLSYKGWPSKGGAIRFKVAPKNGVSYSRNITGKIGLDDTTFWISYLLHPNKVDEGDVFFTPNRQSMASFGMWRGQFSIYTHQSGLRPQNGETYLIVAKYTFSEGDECNLWVNPPVDQEPTKATATKSGMVNAKLGNNITLGFQGLGNGDYTVDEIRLGSTWKEVGGKTSAAKSVPVNSDDHTAPSPSPMTWIGPPSVEKDGSIFMMAVDATDDSGVEYKFECVSNNKLSSDWQDSSSYQIEKPAKGTYKFNVKVRDKSANKNETEPSFTAKVTVK